MATVILTGFMGTGKTSIGERLAERLRRPFVDTDALVEQREGRSVADIFAAEGEAYFRRAEKRAIEDAVAQTGAVIATGGGAIADAESRERLRAAAPIVCLTARPRVILARARAAGATRPLLRGDDPLRRIEDLLAERAPAYAQADLLIDTSDRKPDEIVDEIASFLAASAKHQRASG